MDKRKAELQIGAILAELERETGEVVRGISLSQTETTALHDSNRKMLMTVEIELERLPSHEWAT